ncbi:MAG: hypothetical protein DRJ05_08580 [Bacteroidetes bacterium]|nr:MAG: hypothetical protein DRJ05_08580 [Bacteroidota bacterium]
MPLLSFSQEVENIRFEQEGKMINIYYNLSGTESYDVIIYCSTGENDWGTPLQMVTGAIGAGQTAGIDKEIIWDVLTEREKLTGEVRFKIEVINALSISLRY